ncbi:unnamed protein product [Mytilus coruscus]|uniref:Uncharacterized protein n=1 Tax=Mytilus coruscus TaxID=42192 RepID=A0A6J8DHA4_MYTCO|nr:unnamed protein product [Mytilus coruscus]
MAFVDKLTAKAEEAARPNNIKVLYDNIKLLTENYQKGRRPVKRKEGKTLNAHEEQIKRWVEHFKNVLKQDPPVNKADYHPRKSFWQLTTKVLKSNTRSLASLMANIQALEEIDSFTYIGSVVDNLGGSDKDVKIKIGKDRTAFNIISPHKKGSQRTALQGKPYIGTHKKSVTGADQDTPGDEKLQPRWRKKSTSGIIWKGYEKQNKMEKYRYWLMLHQVAT